MPPIRRITIGGFRGILLPLHLQFVKGRSARSMVIYGSNGTGKSSITDAWEWFHTESIVHLAREGAREGCYPHRYAGNGETYVEVEFSDDALGTIRLDYDCSRITIPKTTGDIVTFRSLVPHPCHIRFEDLTRFVYLTKAQKHDALADLMGFVPQVEFQKALRRVSRQLYEKLDSYKEKVNHPKLRLRKLLNLDTLTESFLLDKLNRILQQYNVDEARGIEELHVRAKSLTEQVESDPRSRELALLRSWEKTVKEKRLPSELAQDFEAYIVLAESFKREEKGAVNFLLLELYEQGEKVLTSAPDQMPEVDRCPLCGQVYAGDLIEHIRMELTSLERLKHAHDRLVSERKRVLKLRSSTDGLSADLDEINREIKSRGDNWSTDRLLLQAERVELILAELYAALQIEAAEMDQETITSLRDGQESLQVEVESYERTRRTLQGFIIMRIEALEEDVSRKQLVADHNTVTRAIDLWSDYQAAYFAWRGLKTVFDRFEAVVEDYVRSNITNVEQRFAIISSKVQTYFEILEEHTEGIGRPALKLMTDRDRAVMLQVEFRGETISPAYRYLSESQLNSFGLAVFLASAHQFNENFKFLVLDDIINSFDGYKRPQVIKLLKEQFDDHQVVLLTHDNVWRDRLYQECPSWVRSGIKRLEPAIGPVMEEGFSELEQIEQYMMDDKPEIAGRSMGPFLERQLQHLCESFEVLVKYNRRNEYTLDPLLDRFRVRVKEKLGKSHPLCRAVEALQKESGFRNLSAHWKNPAIQLTSQEMKIVLDRWKAIEGLVRCDNEHCFGFLQYDGSGAFQCRCGATRLER